MIDYAYDNLPSFLRCKLVQENIDFSGVFSRLRTGDLANYILREKLLMDNYVIVIDYSSVLNLTLTGNNSCLKFWSWSDTPNIVVCSVFCDSKFAILLNALLRVSSYKYSDKFISFILLCVFNPIYVLCAKLAMIMIIQPIMSYFKLMLIK